MLVVKEYIRYRELQLTCGNAKQDTSKDVSDNPISRALALEIQPIGMSRKRPESMG
jgi:hypothetical protein